MHHSEDKWPALQQSPGNAVDTTSRTFKMKISKQLSSPFTWILFGAGTLLLNTLAHRYPGFVEQWYSRGLFQGVRYVLDWTIGRLPFPGFYLFWIATVAFWIFLYRRRARLEGFWPKLGYWLFRVSGFAGLMAGLFCWMWGFNYARIPLETQIGLQTQPIDSSTLWQELNSETQTLYTLRTALVGNDTNAINDTRFWPSHAEDTVREAVEKWLGSEHFPVGGRVRGRFIYPEGTLFKFGASGIYWPFVGEGNVEAGLHPLRKLPAMAHEMSHGYGFCNEGVCNFIAYVACSEHPNAYIAYCARLDYWNTLARACRMNDGERFKNHFLKTIPVGILADEQAIRKQDSKFKELAPDLRYEVYDNYLKSQGIASGMLNYDEVLLLVLAWRKKSGG